MKRMMKTAGLSALGLSVMLAAGCSNSESKKTEPVATKADGEKPSTAATSGENANRNDLALVRVIAAASDAAPVGVIADTNTAFASVAYKDVTPYKAIPSNFDDFALKPAGQDTAPSIASNSESIVGGRHYTVVIFPDVKSENPVPQKVALNVIADDLQTPAPGKVRVRVINAVSGTDDVEVFLRGQTDALFSDVDFKETIAYKEIDPVKTTLEWRTTDSPAKVLGTHALNLEAGKTYTIVIAGKTTEGAKPRFDTIVVEDTVPPQPAATEN